MVVNFKTCMIIQNTRKLPHIHVNNNKNKQYLFVWIVMDFEENNNNLLYIYIYIFRVAYNNINGIHYKWYK
jgi:hypothetical protein